MKKFFSLMFLLALGLGFFSACTDDDDNTGVGLTEKCDIPKDISDDYANDATRLAVRLQQAGGPAANEILIPPALIDRMEAALAAVYNAEFAARDTVFDIYKIHTTETPVFSQLTLEVDTSYAWVKEWEAGNRLTGNGDVDALMNIYGLDLSNFVSLSLGSVATITADDPVNIAGLANAFSGIDGVVLADTGSAVNDGNDIAVVDNGTTLEVTFSVGYDSVLSAGTCDTDCDFRRNWVFTVNDNCEASYVNSYGDPAP